MESACAMVEFGNVVAPGGAGIVIASQSGHRLAALPPDQNAASAITAVDELLALPVLRPDQVTHPLHANQSAKRANSLRVMAEAVRWPKRGARRNTVSPGIIITPLAVDELTGPRGDAYRRMIELSPAGRAGTPDEVGTVAALLMGADGAFITGTDFLVDGGVTASYFYGGLAAHVTQTLATDTAGHQRERRSAPVALERSGPMGKWGGDLHRACTARGEGVITSRPLSGIVASSVRGRSAVAPSTHATAACNPAGGWRGASNG